LLNRLPTAQRVWGAYVATFNKYKIIHNCRERSRLVSVVIIKHFRSQSTIPGYYSMLFPLFSSLSLFLSFPLFLSSFFLYPIIASFSINLFFFFFLFFFR